MAVSVNMARWNANKTWSETWKGRLIVLGSIIGLFMLAFWLAMKSRQTMETPILVIDEQSLSFGEVWEDPAFVWSMLIHNTSNKDVEILGFGADCPCGKIEPPTLSIPAKGTKNVRLTLDLRVPHSDADRSKSDETVAVNGESLNSKHKYPFTIRLTPIFPDGPDRRGGWKITGQVRQVGILVPNEVHFGDSLSRSNLTAKKTVVLHSRVPVSQAMAACDPTVASLEIKRKKTASEEFDVIVTPKMDMKPGPFKTKGKIQLTLTSGEQLPPLLLPISGVMLEDIQVKPASILLGIAPVGTTVDESFLIFSANDTPFDLEQMDSPTGSKLQVVRQSSKGSKQVRLTQEITRKGTQKVSLRFRVRDRKSESAKEIIVPVEYYGIEGSR